MPIDYGRLVGRTWEIFSRNRVLWILGLIAALTGGSSGGSNFNFNTSTSGTSGNVPDFNLFWEQWGGLIVGLACGLVILAIVLSFINAAAEAGMIATVDHIERTREQPAFGAAWGMGTRKMVPIWLVNLVMGLITLFLVLILIVPVFLLFAGSIAAALNSGSDSEGALAGSFLLICLCVCVAVILLIPLLIIVSIVQLLAQRAVVLDNQGVFEAVGSGWRMLNANRGPTLVTWIISLVVGVIEAIAGAIVLFPVSLIFFVPALGALMDPDDFTFADFPWPLLVIGGVVLWLLSGLIGALFRALTSTLWTLFYRNRRQMPNSELAPAGMLPPTMPGGPTYGSPYGPTPDTSYGAPPVYPPAQGPPPPYTPPPAPPASPYGAPPADTINMGYTPPPAPPGAPYGAPPADTTNMGYSPPPTGGVQYGPPYSPPTAPLPPAPGEPPPSAPDDRARGPEGGGSV